MFRLACPAYLNTLPLVHSLDKGQYQIIQDVPSNLATLLLNNQVDVALLPVVDFLKYPQLKIVPATAIISKGSVASVGVFPLQANITLQNAEDIQLDSASHTSQLLLKVLLKYFYQRNLNKINFSVPVTQAQLQLTIGDPCLQKFLTDNFMWDLGQLWQTFQQKPFVYAAWFSTKPIQASLPQDLLHAYQEAKQNMDQLVQQQCLVSAENAKNYLTQNLHYELGKTELNGLISFFELIQDMENKDYDIKLRFTK